MLRIARLGLAGLLVTLATGCATLWSGVEAPEVDVVGLEPQERKGSEQLLRVDLRLRNPNNQALTLEGIRFDLSVNGAPVGRALSSETITVPRLGETVASVMTVTTQLDLMDETRAILSGGVFEYRVSGRLYLRDPKHMQLSFEEDGALPGAGFQVEKTDWSDDQPSF